MHKRAKVLILTGYFDWLSGYQETALASWFSRFADTEVIAGDRVSPMFSDSNLSQTQTPRRYEPGSQIENGIKMTRFATFEKRSMLWSRKVRSYIEGNNYDIILQMMPAQILPFAATIARNTAVRVVFYGDNSSMWSHLTRTQRLAKGAAFAVSKGVLYTLVNWRADFIYGYTPETVKRLRPFSARKVMLPLSLPFDPDRFFFDQSRRTDERQRLGYREAEIVILAAGKFLEKKRLDMLVDAFDRVSQNRANMRLLLVGSDDSEYSRLLRAQINSISRLRLSVQIIEFVDNARLNNIFNAADIGVWPKMPAITIQQAMGTGLSVVLPMNDRVSHLVRGDSGCYYDDSAVDPIEDLADAIESQIAGVHSVAGRHSRVRANAWLGAEDLVKMLMRTAGNAV